MEHLNESTQASLVLATRVQPLPWLARGSLTAESVPRPWRWVTPIHIPECQGCSAQGVMLTISSLPCPPWGRSGDPLHCSARLGAGLCKPSWAWTASHVSQSQLLGSPGIGERGVWAAKEGGGHLLEPSCHGEGSVPWWAVSHEAVGHEKVFWERAWGWGRVEAQGRDWLVARWPCPSFPPEPPTSTGHGRLKLQAHMSRLRNGLLCRGECMPLMPETPLFHPSCSCQTG